MSDFKIGETVTYRNLTGVFESDNGMEVEIIGGRKVRCAVDYLEQKPVAELSYRIREPDGLECFVSEKYLQKLPNGNQPAEWGKDLFIPEQLKNG